MYFGTIASGSSGNCYYVGSEETHLLVDAGVSGKKIESALNEIDRKPSDLNGILVTHEHIDHVKGLGVMARKHGIPIYTTGGTISEIKKMSSVGTIDDSLFHEIEPDEPFFINDLSIDASAIWHDAADPVCYSISDGKSKFSIATDMGNYDEYVVNKLKNSDIMVIEANHDIRMLQAGPYPYYLKQSHQNYLHLLNSDHQPPHHLSTASLLPLHPSRSSPQKSFLQKD